MNAGNKIAVSVLESPPGTGRDKIGARRLEADPAALLCLRCQAFIEGDFKKQQFLGQSLS